MCFGEGVGDEPIFVRSVFEYEDLASLCDSALSIDRFHHGFAEERLCWAVKLRPAAGALQPRWFPFNSLTLRRDPWDENNVERIPRYIYDEGEIFTVDGRFRHTNPSPCFGRESWTSLE